MLSDRSTLGAVGAHVDGRIKHRLVSGPYAVLYHRIDCTSNRTVATHRTLDLDLAFAVQFLSISRGLGLTHQRKLAQRHTGTHPNTGAAQKTASV